MTGTAAKGTLGIGFEPAASPGRQPILPTAVLALTQSATNQPLGSTGCHLLIVVQNIVSGAAATVTINGLKTDGVTALNEATTNITQALADPNNNYYYTTKAAYGSINASGIVASSISGALASATITMYGFVAAKTLVPATALFEEDYDEFSPPDLRGILDEDTRMMQLIKHGTFDIQSALYPESDEWFVYGAIANATAPALRASLPSTPTILHASATFTVYTASFSLTTQPTSPDMLLTFVITGNSLAGTFTIPGVGRYGQVINEVVSVTAGTPNGTFYSQNAFASVGTITTTGFTPAATLVINGVAAFNPIFLPTDTLITESAEWYSGTESSAVSLLLPEEWALEYDVAKELKFSMKGVFQDMATVGDRTVAALTTTNFAAQAQPIDFPEAGWSGLFYLDPINGTAGATQWLDVITFKISGKTGLKPYWTSVGQQPFNRFGRGRRKTTFSAEIDFTNVLLYDRYKAFQKQLIVCKFLSTHYLGNNAGQPAYKYIQVQLNARIVKWAKDPKDEKVIGKLEGTCEYEFSLGYAFNISMLNQNNPNYPV